MVISFTISLNLQSRNRPSFQSNSAHSNMLTSQPPVYYRRIKSRQCAQAFIITSACWAIYNINIIKLIADGQVGTYSNLTQLAESAAQSDRHPTGWYQKTPIFIQVWNDLCLDIYIIFNFFSSFEIITGEILPPLPRGNPFLDGSPALMMSHG